MLAWCKHALFSLLSPSCSQMLFPTAMGEPRELRTDVDRNPDRNTGCLSSWDPALRKAGSWLLRSDPEPLPLLSACRPVPELPGKSTFFVGSTDEFIEKRRQGLQQFLEK